MTNDEASEHFFCPRDMMINSDTIRALARECGYWSRAAREKTYRSDECIALLSRLEEILERLAPDISGRGAGSPAEEPRGTFHCPICGKDAPHAHSRTEIENYCQHIALTEDHR